MQAWTRGSFRTRSICHTASLWTSEPAVHGEDVVERFPVVAQLTDHRRAGRAPAAAGQPVPGDRGVVEGSDGEGRSVVDDMDGVDRPGLAGQRADGRVQRLGGALGAASSAPAPSPPPPPPPPPTPAPSPTRTETIATTRPGAARLCLLPVGRAVRAVQSRTDTASRTGHDSVGMPLLPRGAAVAQPAHDDQHDSEQDIHTSPSLPTQGFNNGEAAEGPVAVSRHTGGCADKCAPLAHASHATRPRPHRRALTHFRTVSRVSGTVVSTLGEGQHRGPAVLLARSMGPGCPSGRTPRVGQR